MDKTNKELAIILLSGHIAGKLANDSFEPSNQDLKDLYERYFDFVKGLPD